MTCPTCGHEEDTVLDSRTTASGKAIRRRRKCRACSVRWTTFEVQGDLKHMQTTPAQLVAHVRNYMVRINDMLAEIESVLQRMEKLGAEE